LEFGVPLVGDGLFGKVFLGEIGSVFKNPIVPFLPQKGGSPLGGPLLEPHVAFNIFPGVNPGFGELLGKKGVFNTKIPGT